MPELRRRVSRMICVRSVLDEHMGIEVLGVGGIPFVIVVKSQRRPLEEYLAFRVCKSHCDTAVGAAKAKVCDLMIEGQWLDVRPERSLRGIYRQLEGLC